MVCASNRADGFDVREDVWGVGMIGTMPGQDKSNTTGR